MIWHDFWWGGKKEKERKRRKNQLVRVLGWKNSAYLENSQKIIEDRME